MDEIAIANDSVEGKQPEISPLSLLYSGITVTSYENPDVSNHSTTRLLVQKLHIALYQR